MEARGRIRRFAHLANYMGNLSRGDYSAFEDTTRSVTSFGLILPDDVTTCEGGVSVELQDWHDLPIVEITARLGPVNAARVIDFMRTLPAEPDDDDSDAAHSDTMRNLMQEVVKRAESKT